MIVNGNPIDSAPGNTGALGNIQGVFREEQENESENNKLTEAQKERIIMEYRDARSRNERKRILREEVPNQNISSLYEGPSAG
ncbi:MAG: hypothetical protein LBM60_03480 [Clostridium sp.]|jgi:hypothetical protein|nr:hypothetical protein [Clostridium sp.]